MSLSKSFYASWIFINRRMIMNCRKLLSNRSSSVPFFFSSLFLRGSRTKAFYQRSSYNVSYLRFYLRRIDTHSIWQVNRCDTCVCVCRVALFFFFRHFQQIKENINLIYSNAFGHINGANQFACYIRLKFIYSTAYCSVMLLLSQMTAQFVNEFEKDFQLIFSATVKTISSILWTYAHQTMRFLF